MREKKKENLNPRPLLKTLLRVEEKHDTFVMGAAVTAASCSSHCHGWVTSS
jgi:hypothetical protein